MVVSVTQNGVQHRPLLVQAPVRALDPDGVAVVTAGTVGFAVAIGACWLWLPQLTAAGKGWYLGVSILGFALGLAGLAFGLARRHRRHNTLPSRALPAMLDEASVEETHIDADGVPHRD